MNHVEECDSAAFLSARVHVVVSHVKAGVITSDAGYSVRGKTVSDNSGWKTMCVRNGVLFFTTTGIVYAVVC